MEFVLAPAAVALTYLLYIKIKLGSIFVFISAALSLAPCLSPKISLISLLSAEDCSGVVNIEMYYEHFQFSLLGLGSMKAPTSQPVGELVAWHFGEENNNNGGIVAR